MKNNEIVLERRYNVKFWIIALLLSVFTTGCMIHEEIARNTINQAVGQAVEAELGTIFSGYTDVMLYQLVYTQAFFLGGFGIVPDDFEEGEGATWHVVTEGQDDATTFTAERALLKRNDDGTSWWYLNFDTEDSEPMEFEVLMDHNLQAREMYLRDIETDEVRHHVFQHNESQIEEAEASDVSMEEAGYQTNYYFLEEWEQYHEGTESISIGAGTYNSDVLLFSSEEDQSDHEYEYRWWVSEDVPGNLLKFEYQDINEGGTLRGEMIDLRLDYEPKFTSF